MHASAGVTARPRHALSLRFYVLLGAAGLATFLLHEAAHWLAGVALGHDMGFRLNGVMSPRDIPGHHQLLVDAAGPLVTIAQAGLAWLMVRRHRSQAAFALLYFAAFMRVIAFGISFVYPNDEARLSLAAGLPLWVLPLLVSVGLVALVWNASRRLGVRWMDHVGCYLVASATVVLIVVADRVVF